VRQTLYVLWGICFTDVLTRHAHDVLTSFMSNHGFSVTPHHHLRTAWAATYTKGDGGRTIGINSEMDALPGIGHACGHNLIAIAGVAVACAIKATMENFAIDGKIMLLGTPGRCLSDCAIIAAFSRS
jgi:metal-dependent amidase/aminoacylase/carboxypeptidase family protein